MSSDIGRTPLEPAATHPSNGHAGAAVAEPRVESPGTATVHVDRVPALEPAPPPVVAPAAPQSAARARDLGVMLDRLEVKYMVDRTRATALARDVSALMRLDAHSAAAGGYVVRSLYFDTPDFLAYHEKTAGEALRHKLRIRVYGDHPAETSPFLRLEIKSRVFNFIHKSTAELPLSDYPEIASAVARRTLPGERLMREPGVREFFRLMRQLNMQPAVIVQYRRRAFERPELRRVRASLDDEIFASRHLDLLGPLRGARRILPYGSAVFELKADGVLTRPLHMLIGKYDLRHEAISKYCYAVRTTARLTALARTEDL